MLTDTVSGGNEETDRIPEGRRLKGLIRFQEDTGGAGKWTYVLPINWFVSYGKSSPSGSFVTSVTLWRATRKLWGQMCPLLISNALTPAEHSATSPPNPLAVDRCFSHQLLRSFSSSSDSVPGTSSLNGAELSHVELSGVWEGEGRWQRGLRGLHLETRWYRW